MLATGPGTPSESPKNGMAVASRKNGSQHSTKPPMMRPSIRAELRMRRYWHFRYETMLLLHPAAEPSAVAPAAAAIANRRCCRTVADPLRVGAVAAAATAVDVGQQEDGGPR